MSSDQQIVDFNKIEELPPSRMEIIDDFNDEEGSIHSMESYNSQTQFNRVKQQNVYEFVGDYNKSIEQLNEEKKSQIEVEIQEKKRKERIQQITSKLQRQLSVINEQSDQSLNTPSVRNQIQKQKQQQQPEQELNNSKILEDKELQEVLQSDEQKKRKKKKKRSRKKSIKKNKIIQIKLSEYEINFNILLYFKDNKVQFEWKLLFGYFLLIILVNILLNIIEIFYYIISPCKLSGWDDILIYANQFLYFFAKLGLVNLYYQEFTNTLTTPSNIPLLNPTLLSSLFPILSMPLYVYDFVTCQSRSNLFTLEQSINFLKFILLFILSIIIIVIFFNTCLKMWLKKKSWRTTRIILYILLYLLMSVIHLLQVMMIFSQHNVHTLPAMLSENYYFFFQLICLCCLSIQKFIFKTTPFKFEQEIQKQQEDK